MDERSIGSVCAIWDKGIHSTLVACIYSNGAMHSYHLVYTQRIDLGHGQWKDVGKWRGRRTGEYVCALNWHTLGSYL